MRRSPRELQWDQTYGSGERPLREALYKQGFVYTLACLGEGGAIFFILGFWDSEDLSLTFEPCPSEVQTASRVLSSRNSMKLRTQTAKMEILHRYQ